LFTAFALAPAVAAWLAWRAVARRQR